MVQMARKNAAVVMVDGDVAILDRQQHLPLGIEQAIIPIAVLHQPEAFRVILNFVVLWLHHPFALFVDEAKATVFVIHDAKPVVEAIVVVADAIRELLVHHFFPIMVDEVERPLLIDASQAIGEDPRLVELCRNRHLTREAIEIPAFVLINSRKASDAVAVRRLADPMDIRQGAASRLQVVKIAGIPIVIDDVRADILVAEVMQIGGVMVLAVVLVVTNDIANPIDDYDSECHCQIQCQGGSTCGKHIPHAPCVLVLGLVAEHLSHPTGGFFDASSFGGRFMDLLVIFHKDCCF